MKKVLFSLLTLFAVVAMTACGTNDTEKKLDGKWEATVAEQGQELTMLWDFDADSHDVKLGIKVGMSGMEMCTVNFNGSFKATADKITFSIDEDKCDVKFTDSFKQMAEMSGSDLKEVENMMLEEMKGELTGLAEEEIVSLTDNTLEVKEDGTNIVFKRVK